MKNYPYFIMDLAILLILVVIVPAGALLMDPPSPATAAFSVLVFALFFKETLQKITDFRSSVKEMPGLESWESDFMSLGTLILHFRGDRMRYSSALKGKEDGLIPVEYTIRAENGSKSSFEIINEGRGWLGEFSASGDYRILEPIEKSIDSFNKRYMISRISNKDGMLETRALLRFSTGKPPSKEAKLDEMQEFLRAFMELNHDLNKVLKSGPAPKKRPAPIRKARKSTRRKK